MTFWSYKYYFHDTISKNEVKKYGIKSLWNTSVKPWSSESSQVINGNNSSYLSLIQYQAYVINMFFSCSDFHQFKRSDTNYQKNSWLVMTNSCNRYVYHTFAFFHFVMIDSRNFSSVVVLDYECFIFNSN